ncbi:MAG: hypothetical protein IPL10_08220 [Bacteroidetes bacterium]|nr:hypothetical protein [Bacteroidota bacterium]
MNHIVLIGNGFDLAHGLKTSYIDFLTWYLKNIGEAVEEKQYYEDDIISISPNTNYAGISIFKNGELSNNPLEIFKKIENTIYAYNIHPEFINNLFSNIQEKRWVDIENSYYRNLISIFNDITKSSQNRTEDVAKLNLAFRFLKTKLIEYLKLQEKQSFLLNNDILLHLQNMSNELLNSDSIYFINFNYTSFIEKYFNEDKISSKANQIKLINIHGLLNHKEENIIFGYGDETDEHYEKLEKLQNKEYLKFIKSFGYAYTNNYQNLITYLGNPFKVHIFGHSCGLSDRVLLKEIFEHNNCYQIEMYYYQKDENTNDFIDKYMDISNHFSMQNKGKMRVRIQALENSKPLVNYIKK